MSKFLKNANGTLTEEAAVAVSAGAADAGKIPELNAAGQIDSSMIPAAAVPVIVASEALAAGDFINVYDNAGTPNVRKRARTGGGCRVADPAKKVPRALGGRGQMTSLAERGQIIAMVQEAMDSGARQDRACTVTRDGCTDRG